MGLERALRLGTEEERGRPAWDCRVERSGWEVEVDALGQWKLENDPSWFAETGETMRVVGAGPRAVVEILGFDLLWAIPAGGSS